MPSTRFANVRGPMPASMSNTPAGDRRIAAFPAEPLARTQISRDIGLACIEGRPLISRPRHYGEIRSVAGASTYEGAMPLAWPSETGTRLGERFFNSRNHHAAVTHLDREASALKRTSQRSRRSTDQQSGELGAIRRYRRGARNETAMNWLLFATLRTPGWPKLSGLL